MILERIFLGIASGLGNFKIAILAMDAQPRPILARKLIIPLAALLAMAGCDAEDPKIRQEMAELRTRLGDQERDNARMTAELQEARSKAQQVEFLTRDVLRRNLDDLMPQVRATLTRAFPGRTVDPVSAGTISTPLDTDGFPYNTELTFGLSEGPGRRVFTYTLNLKANQQGSWRLPELGAFAATLENPAAGGRSVSQPSAAPQADAGFASPSADGPRTIDWGEQNAGSGTSASAPLPPAQPAPAATARPSQPAVNAPFPVQDTRTIEFE